MPGHASHAVQDNMLLLLMLEGVLQHMRQTKQRRRKHALQTWQQRPLPSRHTGVRWLRYQHSLSFVQADMASLHDPVSFSQETTGFC